MRAQESNDLTKENAFQHKPLKLWLCLLTCDCTAVDRDGKVSRKLEDPQQCDWWSWMLAFVKEGLHLRLCLWSMCCRRASGLPKDLKVEISFRKLTNDEEEEEKKVQEIVKDIFKGSSEQSLRFRLREHIDHYPLLAKFCGLRLDAQTCKKLKAGSMPSASMDVVGSAFDI